MDKKGKVKEIGKNIKKYDDENYEEILDVKGNVIMKGIVERKDFVGENG